VIACFQLAGFPEVIWGKISTFAHAVRFPFSQPMITFYWCKKEALVDDASEWCGTYGG